MSSYRFCRTDDIGLLVDALNRCWAPHVPGEPLMTPVAFKRSIRDFQVWCSSCMVAFADGDPIAVLIGAKRPSATFVHRIAVHPDHQRQGHGRHLLSSLGSKLAILGPPRIEAEVPEGLTAARALFTAAGYAEDAILTDYVLRNGQEGPRPAISDRLVIPVTLDDLDANGLLEETQPRVCWERSVETLVARKDEISGLAVASNEALDAHILYLRPVDGGPAEVLRLRAWAEEDDGRPLALLLSIAREQGIGSFRFPKVNPMEISTGTLEALGFRPSGSYRRYATTAGA